MKGLSIRFHFRNFNNGQSNSAPKNVNLEKDYYKILQIQRNTSEHHIRKSYFRLAKKLHPDINPSGHLQFTEIQQAYNILTTKELKDYYDQNNHFYPQQHKQSENNQTHSNQEQEDLNYRNHAFYEEMKSHNWSRQQEEPHPNYEHEQKEKEKEKPEDDEAAKQRKKFEDEIELTRNILFSRNPIWQRANAYMNYEERQRRVEEKQKELQTIFPHGTRMVNNIFKKWNFKG